jgi:hypothetical protein
MNKDLWFETPDDMSHISMTYPEKTLSEFLKNRKIILYKIEQLPDEIPIIYTGNAEYVKVWNITIKRITPLPEKDPPIDKKSSIFKVKFYQIDMLQNTNNLEEPTENNCLKYMELSRPEEIDTFEKWYRIPGHDFYPFDHEDLIAEYNEKYKESKEEINFFTNLELEKIRQIL